VSRTTLPEDNVLFDRICLSDQGALELLYQKYFYPLCDFSIGFVKSHELAEEVVSDVFLNIWLKREALHISSNLKPYLFTAVRNRSINYLQQQKVFLEPYEALLNREGPSGDMADAALEMEEGEKTIETLLDQLPPQRRMIFKLNRVEGMRYKEIAELLSISVNTVQKQMTEATKQIAGYGPALRAALLKVASLPFFWLILN